MCTSDKIKFLLLLLHVVVKPQYQNTNSPFLSLYHCFRSSGEKLISRVFLLGDYVLNSHDLSDFDIVLNSH